MINSLSRNFTLLRRGFTLVEMLVVMAVVAILSSILYPVYAQARESARAAACRSNLRQIGLAIQMYAADYDDTLPNSGSGPNGGDLTALLTPYLRGAQGQSIWKCPSHAIDLENSDCTSSYGYNWQYLLSAGPDYPHSDVNGLENPGLPLACLWRPSETLCFIDQAAPGENGSLWSYVDRPADASDNNGFGRPAFRHNGRANALFCDGHVKSVRPAFAEISQERRHWDPR